MAQRKDRFSHFGDFVRLRPPNREALGKLLRSADGLIGTGRLYILYKRGLAEVRGGKFFPTAVVRKAFKVCPDCHRAIFHRVFQYHTPKCSRIKPPEPKAVKPELLPRCKFCKESSRARCGMCGYTNRERQRINAERLRRGTE